MKLLHLLSLGAIATAPLWAADTDPAASAINALGLDLERPIAAAGGNTCLSPYSIQTALAMAYAGADGATRAEMARVLHYPADEAAFNESLVDLNDRLAAMQTQSDRRAVPDQEDETTPEFEFRLANRLYAQVGFEFRPDFVSQLDSRFHAPPETLDFAGDPKMAAAQINGWVTEHTHRRILDIAAPGAVRRDTGAVLVSALYLRASWLTAFDAAATTLRTFYVSGQTPVDVPTMNKQRFFGYRRLHGFRAVTLPYMIGLQFLVLVPDAKDGLAAVAANLSPKLLREFADLPTRDVDRYLPKFKLEPAAVQLSGELQRLGMKAAFDQPPGSADFGRMAPRRANRYLGLSAVLHKTFIAVDESGTEAAAASYIALATLGVSREPPPPPIVVRVDRPFFFAIQDTASGACLFFGRVVDPR